MYQENRENVNLRIARILMLSMAVHIVSIDSRISYRMRLELKEDRVRAGWAAYSFAGLHVGEYSTDRWAKSLAWWSCQPLSPE